jgi:hypothetical protein
MLDHAQGVATFFPGLAGQFVHQGSHQKDSPAANPQFRASEKE